MKTTVMPGAHVLNNCSCMGEQQTEFAMLLYFEVYFSSLLLKVDDI
jgi:hypothetical protein